MFSDITQFIASYSLPISDLYGGVIKLFLGLGYVTLQYIYTQCVCVCFDGINKYHHFNILLQFTITIYYNFNLSLTSFVYFTKCEVSLLL